VYLPFDLETRLESHRQELLSEADMQRLAYQLPNRGRSRVTGLLAGLLHGLAASLDQSCPAEARQTTTLITG
jgi:hypothetical protein